MLKCKLTNNVGPPNILRNKHEISYCRLEGYLWLTVSGTIREPFATCSRRLGRNIKMLKVEKKASKVLLLEN